ncbi:MAG: dihydropteroate synthase [Chloroflexi bacterium]|nr:dihydropteroate synthase [Chloroflexota bacterium]
MYLIGENLHILSPRFKEAVANRDTAYVQELAKKQIEAGAHALDLNIGPQKKTGPEVVTWLVNGVQEVVDVSLSFDTTNLEAIITGLKLAKQQAIINSTSAQPERLEKVPPVAAEYGAKLVALTMGDEGIPVSAEARVSIAVEKLLPRCEEVGVPIQNVLIDPLVLTVSGCQEYVPQCVEAVRILKAAIDPAPIVSVGLSNVSNQVPKENRPLLNRVYAVMLMAVGLDAMIADPLDMQLREFIRVVETRRDESALHKLLLTLHDRTRESEELTPDDVDWKDPEQVAIFKTMQVLMNKVIYADGYLAV